MRLVPVLAGHRRLEGVCLAGEVALAFVLDLFQHITHKKGQVSTLLLSPQTRRGDGDGKSEGRRGTRRRTVLNHPLELEIQLVSASSIYGLPYQSPSILSLGNVMIYSSLVPSGRSTVSEACPICFTMMEPPVEVFCQCVHISPLCPRLTPHASLLTWARAGKREVEVELNNKSQNTPEKLVFCALCPCNANPLLVFEI